MRKKRKQARSPRHRSPQVTTGHHRSPQVSPRSPRVSFLSYKGANLSLARALCRNFCDSITAVPYEVKARDSQSRLRINLRGFFLSFWSPDPFILKKGPPKAFCLCGLLRIDIYFIRILWEIKRYILESSSRAGARLVNSAVF